MFTTSSLDCLSIAALYRLNEFHDRNGDIHKNKDVERTQTQTRTAFHYTVIRLFYIGISEQPNNFLAREPSAAKMATKHRLSPDIISLKPRFFAV
jgi:hypothetical protein